MPEGGQEGLMIMTTRKRHSPEQVVRKLTMADRLLAEGKDVAAVCRLYDVSPVAQPLPGTFTV